MEGRALLPCRMCGQKNPEIAFFRIKDSLTLCKKCYVECFEKQKNPNVI
jgi:ribosome-binding protein aMBF1 (putative translation factor)